MKPEMITNIVKVIQDNKSFLSELDGVAGDGDHGLNMEKGLTLGLSRVSDGDSNAKGFEVLAETVMVDIGGSMGPLYGTLFYALSENLDKSGETPKALLESLKQAIREIEEFGAREFDKTILDVLYPAVRNLEKSIAFNKNEEELYTDLSNKAITAAKNTARMEAKIGRAARLGERSIGHIDAGAMSCGLIISEIAKAMKD